MHARRQEGRVNENGVSGRTGQCTQGTREDGRMKTASLQCLAPPEGVRNPGFAQRSVWPVMQDASPQEAAPAAPNSQRFAPAHAGTPRQGRRLTPAAPHACALRSQRFSPADEGYPGRARHEGMRRAINTGLPKMPWAHACVHMRAGPYMHSDGKGARRTPEWCCSWCDLPIGCCWRVGRRGQRRILPYGAWPMRGGMAALGACPVCPWAQGRANACKAPGRTG